MADSPESGTFYKPQPLVLSPKYCRTNRRRTAALRSRKGTAIQMGRGTAVQIQVVRVRFPENIAHWKEPNRPRKSARANIWLPPLGSCVLKTGPLESVRLALNRCWGCWSLPGQCLEQLASFYMYSCSLSHKMHPKKKLKFWIDMKDITSVAPDNSYVVLKNHQCSTESQRIQHKLCQYWQWILGLLWYFVSKLLPVLFIYRCWAQTCEHQKLRKQISQSCSFKGRADFIASTKRSCSAICYKEVEGWPRDRNESSGSEERHWQRLGLWHESSWVCSARVEGRPRTCNDGRVPGLEISQICHRGAQ